MPAPTPNAPDPEAPPRLQPRKDAVESLDKSYQDSDKVVQANRDNKGHINRPRR